MFVGAAEAYLCAPTPAGEGMDAHFGYWVPHDDLKTNKFGRLAERLRRRGEKLFDFSVQLPPRHLAWRHNWCALLRYRTADGLNLTGAHERTLAAHYVSARAEKTDVPYTALPTLLLPDERERCYGYWACGHGLEGQELRCFLCDKLSCVKNDNDGNVLDFEIVASSVHPDWHAMLRKRALDGSVLHSVEEQDLAATYVRDTYDSASGLVTSHTLRAPFQWLQQL